MTAVDEVETRFRNAGIIAGIGDGGLVQEVTGAERTQATTRLIHQDQNSHNILCRRRRVEGYLLDEP